MNPTDPVESVESVDPIKEETVGDPSHPGWEPPEGNLIEAPDYSGIEPDPAPADEPTPEPDPGPVDDG